MNPDSLEIVRPTLQPLAVVIHHQRRGLGADLQRRDGPVLVGLVAVGVVDTEVHDEICGHRRCGARASGLGESGALRGEQPSTASIDSLRQRWIGSTVVRLTTFIASWDVRVIGAHHTEEVVGFATGCHR